MKNFHNRLIATILALAMLWNVIPVNAETGNVNHDETDTSTTETTQETTAPYIIAEDTDKRTESEKHFLRSDGSYIAAVYDSAVHYQTDTGAYEEIDNRLTEEADEEGTAVYATKRGPRKVKLAKKATANKLVTIHEKEYKISWGFEGVAKVKGTVVEAEAPPLSGDDAFLTVTGLSSETRYENAFPKVDLQYFVTPEGVKENLILKDATAQRSYQMNYKIGNKLHAAQADARTIELWQGAKKVYTISAPVMTDANGASSDQLTLTLIEEKNGKLTVVLTADSEWLDDPARAYPVTVDPSFVSKQNVDMLQSKYFMSTYQNNQASGTLYVGYQRGQMNHTCSAVKFALPSLAQGDMIVNAEVCLLQRSYERATTDQMQVNAYQITSNVTWPTSGNAVGETGTGPSYNSTVLDYAIVSSSTNNTYVYWNVTGLVKKWYTGIENKGILFRPNNYNQYDQVLFGSKYASSSNIPQKPAIIITYINNTGLEDYWDYTTADMGTSGTAYVNNYTGNLVAEVPVTHTNSANMPVSVSMVYNGYQAGAQSANIICGAGWKLNYDQKIYYNAGTDIYDIGYHYRLVDADGTIMYLKQKSHGVYEDELGKGYTITAAGGIFTMVDKAGNTKLFDGSGRLTEIRSNTSNDRITLAYNGTLLSTITDGSGQVITITRNAENKVTAITDPYGRAVTWSYSDEKTMRLTYPDTKTIQFNYDNNRLSQITQRDGAKIKFTYPITGLTSHINRVSELRELSTSNSVGSIFAFDYSQGNATRITDHKGRTTTFTFDNYGRTTSAVDETGAIVKSYEASSYTAGNMNKNHKLKQYASASKPTNNLVRSHSFEDGRTKWGLLIGYGADKFSVDSSVSYLGQKSIKQTNTMEDYALLAQEYHNLPAGNYTFSIYAKTAGMTGTGGAFVVLRYFTDTGTSQEYISRKVMPTTWERLSITGNIPANATRVVVLFGTYKAAGTSWFDCAQLEMADAPSDYNLIENSFFENGSTGWECSFGAGEGIQNASNFSNSTRPANIKKAVVLKGSYGQNRWILQTIPVNLPAKDVALYFGGYACGQSVPLTDSGRYFALDLRFDYSDGTKDYLVPYFNAASNTWQYTAQLLTPKAGSMNKHVTSVTVYCLFYQNANTAAFSGLQLTLDKTGVVYSYDSKGNMVSAKDMAKREAVSTIDNANRLTKYTDAEGTSYSYTYNTTYPHRVDKAVHEYYQQAFDFGYNSHGQLIQTTQRHNTDTTVSKIRTGATYSADGRQLLNETDQLQHTKTYTYNDQGLLSGEAMGSNIISYQYNTSDLVTSVQGSRFTNDGQTQVLKNTYDYQNDRLSQITHNGFSYNFTYTGFGRPLQTKVGTQTLITNSYAPYNGPLATATYGNGTVFTYLYDRYERLTQRKLGDTVQYEWAYDAKGNVARHRDLVNGKNYTYSYDLLGRLLSTSISDGNRVNYTYDELDRLTRTQYVYNGVTHDYLYEYFKGGTAKSTTISSVATINRALNDLAQVESTTLTTPSVLNWKTDYTYYSPGTGLTSNVIGSMTHNPIGLTISYQYDNRGYISKMLENGVEQAAYTYDAAGQLVRENNKKLNKTICYEYDNGGNLLWKKEYAYTTGALGDATKTYSYGYADTVWKDKLTSYNGESITYDAIGNPLTYLNGLRFTWTGRQLTGISYNLIPGSYSYNADGIRTKKVINGTVTEYYLEGSRILGQKTGEQEQWYHYDSDGSRVGIQYKGENYYYYYNAQGDVLGLFDKTLNKVVEYVYDSWGKIESITGTLASSLGQANPFRYRGYYYDSESGLYYLNSRYYDPETGRFLNADGVLGANGDILSYNLFAYCSNNPVNLADPSGESPTAVLGGALAGAGKALLASIKTLVVASVVVIAGILVVDLINNAIQAKQNEQALKVAQAEDELPNIASGYGNLKCKEAASAMQRYLKKNKLHGAFVTLSFPNAHNGFVVSKSKGGDAISRNGIHMGILFNGKIYCNVHPYGLPKQMWINDFEASAPPRNYYEMKF